VCSNNSVICNDISKLLPEFWDGYEGKGEPYGIINRDLARKVGRLMDGDKFPDPDIEGVNPCAEQSLCNLETCCLAEIFLPNIDSLDELKKVGTMLYRICKHSLSLPCHHLETQEIVHKNFRMGIGITGYMQCREAKRAWLPEFYDFLRSFDVQYSALHGFPISIKLTTVKPSGTLSLLAGVTPGVHPGLSLAVFSVFDCLPHCVFRDILPRGVTGIYQYFIRRIRISTTNPLVNLCRKSGYHCEFQIGFDGTEDRNTTVVSFPCKYPAGTQLASGMTAINQLETVKRLQKEYSDNAVSWSVRFVYVFGVFAAFLRLKLTIVCCGLKARFTIANTSCWRSRRGSPRISTRA
jgi:ribonucleoside-triphosphate reductase